MICWNKPIAGIHNRPLPRSVLKNNSLWFGFVKRQIHYHWGKMDDSPSSSNVIVLRQLHTEGYYIYKPTVSTVVWELALTSYFLR